MKIVTICLSVLLLVGIISGCGMHGKTVINLICEGTLNKYQPEAGFGYQRVNIAISKQVFTFPEASMYVLDDNLNRVSPILGKYYYLYQVIQFGQTEYILSQHKYSEDELR